MDVIINKPETGVVAVIGASLWENQDTEHVKPKGIRTVKAEYIDGLPIADVYKKAISISIHGDISLDSYSMEVPFNLTIESVRMAVIESPAESDLIVDILTNDTTLYTTTANRPTIAIGDTRIDAHLPDITSLNALDILTFEVAQAGTASELMITIICSITEGEAPL